MTEGGKSISGSRPEQTGDEIKLSSVEEIVEEARHGRMVILVDDENRENEGDLFVPAEWCTPDAVNFMAKFGRGLICLAMDRPNVERLGLQLMTRKNSSRLSSAFTVSIEAREGIRTGISAADRARTIQVAISRQSGPQDIATPGHVFPLIARDGGVLVRAGHTEAVVDISRMAGLIPAGVICEVMSEDGTMARLPELAAFAQRQGIKIGTIADLIAYRRRTETFVKRTLETDYRCAAGDFRLIVYVNTLSQVENLVLVKGDVTTAEPALVRMHAVNLLDDLLPDLTASAHASDLFLALRQIEAAGRGALVLLREAEATPLSSQIKSRLAGDVDSLTELRDYGVGAQILLDLGIRDAILLTNHRRSIIGLEGFGLNVVEQRVLERS